MAAFASILGLLVLTATGIVSKDRLIEEWNLWKLERGDQEEKRSALVALVTKGSRRAVPFLVRQILDPTRMAFLRKVVEGLPPSANPFPENDESEVSSWNEPREFLRVDSQTLSFLEMPSLKPAVQFGCAIPLTSYEDRLEEALEKAPPESKMQALAILLRVRAPSSVDGQWKALQALRAIRVSNDWDEVLSEMEGFFDAETLLDGIRRPPPSDRYSESSNHSWFIRAVGVRKVRDAIPRLKELSVGSNLEASLAAERSLENFEGAEGDEALLYCILGWEYDAYVRAGMALLERNKSLLIEALPTARVPNNCRYWQAILLARCESPSAVPILCSEVAKIAILDEEMFDHISRLASEEHRHLIDALPSQVRREQIDRAKAVVKRFRERFGRSCDQETRN